MIICEFCLQYQQDGKCGAGLSIRKKMSCRIFDPGLEKFCSKPSDFKSSSQIIQMATFFGIRRGELKKVEVMVKREEKRRLETPPIAPSSHAETAHSLEVARVCNDSS